MEHRASAEYPPVGPKCIYVLTLCALLFALCSGTQAQPTKIPRISYLTLVSRSVNAARIEAFRRGLRDLGYVEGKNIVIEWRFAEDNRDHLPALASELVRLQVEIIVTGGALPTQAAKNATSTIPIVMTQDPNPVANGFVASLARPGGNITGLATLSPEISGKRLELLKEIIPKLSHVVVLGTSNLPGDAQSLKETERAANALKVKIQYLDILVPQDVEMVFQVAKKARAEAVLVLTSALINSHRAQLVALAAKHQLPAIYPFPEYVEAGGLMTYGVSFIDLAQRAATYVDRILKGAKPADLPVEQPKKFDLIINLKTARQIGLTIPPQVLARADRVIR